MRRSLSRRREKVVNSLKGGKEVELKAVASVLLRNNDLIVCLIIREKNRVSKCSSGVT